MNVSWAGDAFPVGVHMLFLCVIMKRKVGRQPERESGKTALPSGTFINRAAGEEYVDDLNGN